MGTISWLIAMGLVVSGISLAAGIVTVVWLVVVWSEPRIRIPIPVEPTTFDGIRHVATRDWLRSYTLVLESLGFQPRPIYLLPSGLRAGRVAFAWFSRPDSPTLALLTCSPMGHGVAFLSGTGEERLETTTEIVPLSLRGRDTVRREVRIDLTDPAALLVAHDALAGPPPAEAAEPPVDDATLQESLVQSYLRVLALDERAARRARIGAGSSPTLRGRVAAAWRRLKRHAEEAALQVERR